MRGRHEIARLESALGDWSEVAVRLAQSPEERFFTALAARVLAFVHSAVARHRITKILRWHATNGISSGGETYAPLWELHHWQHQELRKVDKTLCAALLADLRSDYNDSTFLHGQRTKNCALLLDNSGTRAGSRFLDLLEECRRESDRAAERGDPLLVVAVRHRRPPAYVGEPAVVNDHPAFWFPIGLTDLTRDDVVDLTRSSLLGSARRDADFIHAITHGHPEATVRLARELDQGRLGAAAEDCLIGLLKGIFADEPTALDAMAACAATPGLRKGACQAVFRFLGWTEINAVEVHRLLTTMMWLDETSDGSDPNLHPLPRLLLQRWLAREPTKWREVHEGYMAHYAAPDTTVLRQHHKLALVERPEHLAEVVSYLDGEFARHSPRDWLVRLDTVTRAPNRLPLMRDPRVLVTRLAGIERPGSRDRVIARLTAAMWLHSTRLSDPEHRLATLIADGYDHLASLCEIGGEVFFDESAKYRRIHEEWED